MCGIPGWGEAGRQAESPRRRTVAHVTPTFPDRIPHTPGVYRFVDAAERPLYIGKAKDLHNRLSHYRRGALEPRIATMVSLAHRVTFVTCASEAEALLLEREWISREQPPFNVSLRNGSGYAGIALSNNAVPRVSTWRGSRPPDSQCFGPYPGVRGKTLLHLVQAGFAVRTCTDSIYRAAAEAHRPCLLGETHQCVAPCLGEVERAEHSKRLRELAAFLEGRNPQVVDRAWEAMRQAADAEQFEQAAIARDRAKALEHLQQRQTVISDSRFTATAVSIRRADRDIVVAVAAAKDGTISSVDTFRSINDPAWDDQETFDAVLHDLSALIRSTGPYLSYQSTQHTRTPRGKNEKALVAFTDRQADQYARDVATTPWQNALERLEAVRELTDTLGLPRAARRIEAIDISHLNGKNTVGRLVTLLDGFSHRSDYRALPLDDTHGDDLAAISALVHARFTGNCLGLGQDPDLLLIDGGPLQVAAAAEQVRASGRAVPVVGLAKRLEEVWSAGSDAPLILGRNSASLRLLMQARDDVHNAAISSHRARRTRDSVQVRVDTAPGIGPGLRAKLLQVFGTWAAVLGASETDLVAAIGQKRGSRLYQHLHQGHLDGGTDT